MIKFKVKFNINAGYNDWYLIPTIMYGLRDNRDKASKDYVGFLSLLWLKGYAGLSWTIKD